MGNKVLEKLIGDRDEVNEQVDHVLATAEADGRGPSETEQKTIARCTTELADLEAQIAPLVALEEQRANSRDVHAVLNRSRQSVERALGVGENGQRGVPEPIHRTAGQFIVDYLRARGGMQIGNGQVLAPDPSAIERMAPWIERAVANQTTTDTPGLLPEPVIGDVLGQKTAVQPFVSSIGGAKPMGGIPGKTFSRPTITQHTLVGVQTAEKTELPSRKMVIGSIPFTKVTKGGVVDISRQDIDWSVPSAWDILLSDLAAVYGEEVENEVADDAVAKATAGPSASANTMEGWATALLRGGRPVLRGDVTAAAPQPGVDEPGRVGPGRPGHRRRPDPGRRPDRQHAVLAGRGRVLRQHVLRPAVRRAQLPRRHVARRGRRGVRGVRGDRRCALRGRAVTVRGAGRLRRLRRVQRGRTGGPRQGDTPLLGRAISAPSAPADEGKFDPADNTVDEVKAYVDAYPDDAEAVLQAETAGKNRTTLVGWLEERLG